MTPGQAQQLTSYLYGLKTPEAVQQFAAQHQNDALYARWAELTEKSN